MFQFGVAIRMTIVSVVLLGLIYPLAMTGAAQAIFPREANGSLVMRDGKVVGSDIIGQRWSKPEDFQGRPSAAGKNGYDPTATGGTNLGPTSAKLIAATKATIAQLRKQNPQATVPLPIDLATTSGSGIDPDISVQGAYYQAPRVAFARHLPLAQVDAVISRAIEPRELGILGEPHVNVLELNLALDALSKRGGRPGKD